MRLTLVAVGRIRGPLQDLFDDYAGRLPWRLTAHEIDIRAPAAEMTRREGAAMAKHVKADAIVVALDRRGSSWSSEDFAKRLSAWQGQGRDVAFLIGGADGLAPDLIARADAKLSLGPMVWPHLLARVMLAEQLYRASAILARHPYHRGD